MSICLVAAIAENNCIGANGKLPWHIPEDMQHFKEKTAGQVVLMGRKTWESIPHKFRPLPGRTNVVITRQTDFPVPAGVEMFNSVADALAAHTNNDVAVIGGAQIYSQTIDRADTLHITHIHRTVDGDAFFPPIDPAQWTETQREDRAGFSFVTYRRQL